MCLCEKSSQIFVHFISASLQQFCWGSPWALEESTIHLVLVSTNLLHELLVEGELLVLPFDKVMTSRLRTAHVMSLISDEWFNLPQTSQMQTRNATVSYLSSMPNRVSKDCGSDLLGALTTDNTPFRRWIFRSKYTCERLGVVRSDLCLRMETVSKLHSQQIVPPLH